MTKEAAPIPKAIKVGPIDYEVIVDELEFAKLQIEAEEPTLAGHTSERKCRIYVDVTMPPALVRTTLLHEALHAITLATSLAPIVSDAAPDDRDERIVRVLELPLYALLRENPDLVAFLLDS